MADDHTPRRVSRTPAPPPRSSHFVPSPPQQNSSADPPTPEAVKRVVDEIRADQGYRFPQRPLSNVGADNPEWVGTRGGTPDATGDDLEEGLRAVQKLARDRADAGRRIGEAAKPVVDAAGQATTAAAESWEEYSRLQMDRIMRGRATDEREDKQNRRQAIADAIKQSEPLSEKTTVANSSFSETNAWIYGGVGGAAFSTVFGIGLVGIFYEHRPVPGAVMSLIGFAGLAAMIFLLKGHRLTVIHAAMAALFATWVFLGYVLWAGPKPPATATGRTWQALTNNEKTLLALALRNLPKRDHFRIICLTSDCKDLATDFMGVMHDANWNPTFSSASSFFSEPYGLVIYQKDVNDHSIADAIEKTTNLKIDHIEGSNDPTIESIFLGLRP